jgi:hypothetical protein
VTLRHTRILNGLFLALGVALLVVMLLRLDAAEVWERILASGWALVPAFGAYCGSLLVSTLAWGRLFPREHRARFGPLFAAFWAGHAVNMVTPGGATGTVLKGTLLARRIDGEEVTASLVTYSYFDAVSMICFTTAGPLLCLLWYDVPAQVVGGLLALSGVLGLGALGLRVLLRRGLAADAVRLAGRVPFLRLRNLERLEERAGRVDVRVQEFRRSQPADFRATVAFFVMARAFQVLEAFFLLLPLVPEESAGGLLLLALLTQSTNQLINWLAAFVPARVGVAEGGIALLYQLLGMGAGVGLAYGLLRRARVVVGVSIGLVIGAVLQARAPRSAQIAADAGGSPLTLGRTDL